MVRENNYDPNSTINNMSFTRLDETIESILIMNHESKDADHFKYACSQFDSKVQENVKLIKLKKFEEKEILDKFISLHKRYIELDNMIHKNIIQVEQTLLKLSTNLNKKIKEVENRKEQAKNDKIDLIEEEDLLTQEYLYEKEQLEYKSKFLY